MMNLPFTSEQFFEIFEKYNAFVFPAQIVLLLLGSIGVWLVHSKKSIKNIFIGIFLALLWMWIGVVYHWYFFTAINKAAYLFGGLFMLQGIFFIIETFFRKKLQFESPVGPRGYLGYFFLIFGLVLYPLISYFLEGDWGSVIALGLPCPSTILSFGFLMLTTAKFPKYLLIIPSVWALIGTGAATNLGVYQDYVMLLAAMVAVIFLAGRKKTNGGKVSG